VQVTFLDAASIDPDIIDTLFPSLFAGELNFTVAHIPVQGFDRYDIRIQNLSPHVWDRMAYGGIRLAGNSSS
jgi:hypothetical protein